jgi:hypothetical protein
MHKCNDLDRFCLRSVDNYEFAIPRNCPEPDRFCDNLNSFSPEQGVAAQAVAGGQNGRLHAVCRAGFILRYEISNFVEVFDGSWS